MFKIFLQFVEKYLQINQNDSVKNFTKEQLHSIVEEILNAANNWIKIYIRKRTLCLVFK